MAELLEPYRSQYFISGEINSEVADQQAKMDELEASATPTPSQPPRRGVGRLPRLALQRAPVQHRAAAAAQPRVARVAAGHGAPARRGAGGHPLVTTMRRAGRAAEQGIHRLAIPTPFAVGRVNTLPDRGRSADARGLGPELGQGADELERGAGVARPSRRGPGAAGRHPPAHRPPRAAGRPRPALGREVAALDRLAPYVERYGEDAELDDEFADAAHAPSRPPGGRRGGPALGVARLPGLGVERAGDPPLGDGEELRLRDRRSRCMHRPGHSPTTPSSGTPTDAS